MIKKLWKKIFSYPRLASEDIANIDVVTADVIFMRDEALGKYNQVQTDLWSALELRHKMFNDPSPAEVLSKKYPRHKFDDAGNYEEIVPWK